MLCKVLIFELLVQLGSSMRVQLSTGEIEGNALNATYSPYGHQAAIVFFGIPYAQPPVGELRFRKTRPPARWRGILETKIYKPPCMSDPKKSYKNGENGEVSEDCLYINVFTNRHCLENKNCAVMVIIHGGAYVYGSGSAFNPEILINNFVGQGRNIVVVSVSYRLGIFGFGHLNGDGGDTNAALFDILEAIKWVRREIEVFGGNKGRITLAGHSAGGTLIVAVTNSPLSKGLVHQQMLMSAPFSHMSKQLNYKAMTAISQRVGCLPEKLGFEKKLPTVLIEQTYSCLREKTAQELLDAQLSILQNSTFYLGAPSVDGRFITDYFDKTITSKRIFPINTIIGTVIGEIKDSTYITDPKNADKKGELLRNICEHIGYQLYTESEMFAEKCQNFYRAGSNAQFLSDDMDFYVPAIKVANAHRRGNAKVYMYSYAYAESNTAFQNYLEGPSPNHSEDLIYVFGGHRGVFTLKDYAIERIYSGIFANFVNFGNPTISKEQPWLEYTPERKEHFVIDFDENFTMPGMSENYYGEAYQFWSTAGRKSFNEHWSPSLDTFAVSSFATPITSFFSRKSADLDKTLQQMDKLFFEENAYLKELKSGRKVEPIRSLHNGSQWKSVAIQVDDVGKGRSETINIFSAMLALSFLASAVYISISIMKHRHRRLRGYELIK